MNLHLAEIAEVVDPGAHAIVLLDQAGWHKAKDFNIPDNISLLPLPPRSPELNPVENVWLRIPTKMGSTCATTGSPTAC
jgi:transposase